MKSKYKIGIVCLDGYKCWAKHPPLNTYDRAKACAFMAYLGGQGMLDVKEAVIVQADQNKVIQRYNGEWKSESDNTGDRK